MNSQKRKIAILIRTSVEQSETRGTFLVFNGDELEYSCKILELPDKNNKPQESCIPIGIYTLVPRSTQSKGNHLGVVGVPDRFLILIHKGNFTRDSQGCQLPGTYFTDLDGDGTIDVADSKKAMDKITSLITEPTPYLVVATKISGGNQ